MGRNITKKWGLMIMVTGLVIVLLAFGMSCKVSATTTPPVTTTPSPTQAVAKITITTGFSGAVFFPETVTVPVGTIVTWWSNDVLDAHTVTSDSGLFDSGLIPEARKESPPTADETFSYTFTERGTFSYYCAYHPSVVGKVIVE